MRNYLNQKTRDVDSVVGTVNQLLMAAGSQKPILIRCLIFSVISAITFGISLVLLFPFFAAIVNGQDWQLPFGGISVLLFISLVSRLFSESYDTKGYANLAIDELRKRLGQKLRQIPLLHLSNQRSGEINAVLVQSVNEAAGYGFMLMTTIIYAMIVPISAAIAMVFYDWRFAVVMLLVFPMAIPLYFWRRKAFRRGFSILAEANGQLKGEAIEFIQGLDVLKSTGELENKQSTFADIAHDVAKIQAYGTKKGEIPNLMITSTVQLGLVFIILLGIFLVGGGSASYFLLATAIIIIARVTDLLNFFVQMSSLLEIFVIGCEKLQQLLSQPDLPEKHCDKMPTSFDITFENVDFVYQATQIGEADHKDKLAKNAQSSKEIFALHNINVTIPERSFTALVGHSGSGKTTLTRMILRHADVIKGAVKIGGVDIREMTQKQLMEMISVVFQDVYLFQDTIMNNIRMARPDATDEEVVAAAEKAQCHEFIMKTAKGYDTPLLDLGSSLSGGEKQRIAIARAILKDAPILILDEPTAALDTKNELLVQRALDALLVNKTILVIAHRLSTIVGAHQILVMEEGAIIEQGEHEALLAKKGRYYEFWNTQHIATNNDQNGALKSVVLDDPSIGAIL
ncbi:ABC transporter ATP-binding protein/permease [Ignatzschineria rhizosphaerae]|uniref:ABC transporter ATP-binding protein/permease n=1 Tax=Ignatzschineria rhizosphaerae TaxID=2923279 RepID=A0ABY3X200_9GAMM|nr:ABC transporter ATP-binding protein [Ignatzschineria rhizosphaerae]UNM96896.1 ABC transporter ATP-binding protein/permease [Ignatzschineria rhizosphaerae]